MLGKKSEMAGFVSKLTVVELLLACLLAYFMAEFAYARLGGRFVFLPAEGGFHQVFLPTLAMIFPVIHFCSAKLRNSAFAWSVWITAYLIVLAGLVFWLGYAGMAVLLLIDVVLDWFSIRHRRSERQG